MRIIFDHQIFCLQNFGGISRYFVELINGLGCDKEEPILCLRYSNNEYLKKGDYKQFKGFPHLKLHSRISKVLNNYIGILNKYFLELINRKTTISILRLSEGIVFHPTYYNPYFLPYLKNNKLVVTVHDMIHEKYAKCFPPYDPTKGWKIILINRADRIIAISENTKSDILELLPNIDPAKIDVVYHGSYLKDSFSSREIDHCKKHLKLPKKYLLFVGNRSNYKNFNRFVEAVSPVFEKNMDLNVVCAGGNEFNGDEISKLQKLNIANKVIYLKFKDNLSLVCLYRNAVAFVFPSLYEGFGLPILEAFECGCPVICSNIGCFNEAAGDAAEYFDPNNINSMTESIAKVLEDSSYRNLLIKKGKLRKENFSVKKMINETKKVYEKAFN